MAVSARPGGDRCAWLVAAVGSLCFFTVDSADYPIVTDFGKPTQVITTPGWGSSVRDVRTFDHRLFVYAAAPAF